LIISASFRTDIPAFYGEWFLNRIQAGFCLTKNPYGGQVYQISLRKADVDGIFFWTKNLGPFLPRLEAVNAMGYPFVVLYSITGYLRELEPATASTDAAIEHLHVVAQRYGKRVGVWRYDPIVITSLTDFDFHRANFSRIAKALAGVVDEVIVSYVQYYKKTQRNMERTARQYGFAFEDPDDETKLAFLAELAAIAQRHGMKLSLCAQPQYLIPEVAEASCIDAVRLSEIAGRPISGKKPGHRGKQCACSSSRDIGAYDTCLHGCVYCYATANNNAARQNYRRHDPQAESIRLIEREEDINSIADNLSLFGKHTPHYTPSSPKRISDCLLINAKLIQFQDFFAMTITSRNAKRGMNFKG